MVSTSVLLTFRPWRLRLLGAHLGVQSSSIKEAAAQAWAALTATAQAGVLAKGAAAQAGAALTATAQAGVLAKGAAAQAGRAPRWRLLKQRLLRYKRSSTAKSETKILVNRAF